MAGNCNIEEKIFSAVGIIKKIHAERKNRDIRPRDSISIKYVGFILDEIKNLYDRAHSSIEFSTELPL